MKKVRNSFTIFGITLILSILFYFFYRPLFLPVYYISLIFALISLYFFVVRCKRKKIGKMRIEYIDFVRDHMLRVYFKKRNLWIIYDRRKKVFRKPNFVDILSWSFSFILFGLIFLYLTYNSFVILFLMTRLSSWWLVTVIPLLLFSVLWFYLLFMGVSRLFSLRNKKLEKICSKLNKERRLKRFISKEKARLRITPNFLFKEGYVTSLELFMKRRPKPKKIEKPIIRIVRILKR